MKRIVFAALFVLVCLSYSPSGIHAQAKENRVTAGEFLIDPPTLLNLGFEWFITGDDNRNANVEVRFRKAGDTAWRQALPLLRLNGEEIYNGAQLNVVVPNMFAGSILDLEPDTAYECTLTLSDPDGGNAVKTITVRTRPEPRAFEGGRVFHVVLPNVNEGFTGRAPDLGALEFGKPLPHFGPRS
jgi:hypothetical protein